MLHWKLIFKGEKVILITFISSFLQGVLCLWGFLMREGLGFFFLFFFLLFFFSWFFLIVATINFAQQCMRRQTTHLSELSHDWTTWYHFQKRIRRGLICPGFPVRYTIPCTCFQKHKNTFNSSVFKFLNQNKNKQTKI